MRYALRIRGARVSGRRGPWLDHRPIIARILRGVRKALKLREQRRAPPLQDQRASDQGRAALRWGRVMRRALRVWIPTGDNRDQISHWIWTRRAGLRVVYADGLTCRSSWQGLRHFLGGIRAGRCDAREVTP